jgi:hypothetical protein
VIEHTEALKEQILRDKMIDVLQGRYWIPEREQWMAPGRTMREIIERVNFCGVWGLRHRDVR